MSDYNQLLDQISARLGLDSNYYETEIKKDLPSFQKQELRNIKDGFSSGNQNDKYHTFNQFNNYFKTNPLSGNVYIDNSDTKSRKKIEKEMEPYLNKVKNELNFMMDQFREEIGNYVFIQPKIKSFEEEIKENKKSFDSFKEDYNNQMFELNNTILEYKLKIEKCNEKIDNMNNNMNAIEELNHKLEEINRKNEEHKKKNRISKIN